MRVAEKSYHKNYLWELLVKIITKLFVRVVGKSYQEVFFVRVDTGCWLRELLYELKHLIMSWELVMKVDTVMWVVNKSWSCEKLIMKVDMGVNYKS